MHPFPDSDCGSFPRPHSATGICYCLPDRFCGRVEIGRQARLRIWCASVWVRVPSPALHSRAAFSGGSFRSVWRRDSVGLRYPIPKPLPSGKGLRLRRGGAGLQALSLRSEGTHLVRSMCAFGGCFAHGRLYGRPRCALEKPRHLHQEVGTYSFRETGILPTGCFSAVNVPVLGTITAKTGYFDSIVPIFGTIPAPRPIPIYLNKHTYFMTHYQTRSY